MATHAIDRVEIYRQMLRSRRLEEGISTLWHRGLVSAEMHLNLGEEGIIAGVVLHLEDGDGLATDHRSTAPFLIRGADPSAIVAECMGLESGLCGGRGGHMHLYAKELLAAASGIVGAAGPIACGFALARQQLAPGHVAVGLFGEGAFNQGMLMESMNLAAAWELPVLFVCKDNGMAITTPSAKVTAGDLVERARGLGVPGTRVDGTDVEEVWRTAGDAIARMRDGGGPFYLHATCVRPEGHFLGDPLIRIARSPVHEMQPRLGPLVAATTGAGGTVGERAASFGTIASVIGRITRTQVGHAHDPLRRLRKRLEADRTTLAELEASVVAEIDAAIRRALDERAGTEAQA